MVVGQMAPTGRRYPCAPSSALPRRLPLERERLTSRIIAFDYRVNLAGCQFPVLAPLRWGVFFAQEQRTSGESWVRRGRAPSFSTDATIGNVLLLVHLS